MKDSILNVEQRSAIHTRARFLRWVNLIAFILVVAFNGLASSGKISGYAIGEVSRAYPTYITPASYAFSIWGIIYTLVALFVIFQCLSQQQNSELIFGAIGWLFALSCLCNVLWILIFCWKTEATTWLSTFFIFGILACLLAAHQRCKSWCTPDRTWVEVLCVDTMLSLYAGWVTVACIVNVAAAFVSSEHPELGWTAEGWCSLMLVVAALINVAMLFRCNDSVFGLVFVWAAIAIAKDTPSEMVKTQAHVYAGIVGTLCVLVGVYRAWYFYFREGNRLNLYTRPTIREDEDGVPAVI